MTEKKIVGEESDLNNLINQANRDVLHKGGKLDHRPNKWAPTKRALNYLAMVAIFIVCIMVGGKLLDLLLPPADAEIEADLRIIILQAQAAIEESYEENGVYPESLPNSAQAVVVNYTHTADGYLLSATLRGVVANLEQGDVLKIYKGEQR